MTFFVLKSSVAHSYHVRDLIISWISFSAQRITRYMLPLRASDINEIQTAPVSPMQKISSIIL